MLPQTLFNTLPKKSSPFWNDQCGGLDYHKIVGNLIDIKDKKAKISEITGVSKNSVRYDSKMPIEVKEFLHYMVSIFHMVYTHLDNDFKKTKLWFELPNPLIGEGVSPKDMIHMGRHHKLFQIVSSAVDGERA